jgi:hypothetical protein
VAGYSGTPLAKKLGIRENHLVATVNQPANYLELLDDIPPDVRFTTRVERKADIVHLFVTRRADLSRALTDYRSRLDPKSAVWVSWPKKSSKVATDITEDVIREVALPLGFVDIKVCAVDDTWSGLKLVVRLENR